MITEIDIEGFKSFRSSTRVAFSPLTILAGANSAGKSTILQSLLVLKQTLEFCPSNGSLRLNGPLVSLGTPDVASAAACRIATLERDAPRFEVVLETGTEKDRKTLHILSISVGGVSARRCNTVDAELEAYLQERRILGDVYEIETGKDWIVLQGLSAKLGIRKVDGLSKKQHEEIRRFVHNYLAEQLADALTNDIRMSGGFDREHRNNALEFFASGDIASGIRDMRKIQSLENELSQEDLIAGDSLDSLSKSEMNLVADVAGILDLRDFEHQLRSLTDSFSDITYEDVDQSQLIGLSVITKTASNVHYLGPLREEPKIVHPDVLIEDVGAIGSNGSNSASFLFYHGDRLIKVSLPAEGEYPTRSMELRQLTLLESVNYWLRYLGVAYEVRVSQDQPYGLSIKVVSEEGGPEVALTNVGVGVSQVLPILVMGLGSKEGQVVIYEQAELHLHPAVQSKLADFFVSLVRSGIQVVLESHSEHLVTRIRLHVSRATIEPSTVCIHFVSKDEGGSRISTVDLDEEGFIQDWPDGFFDEAEKNLTELLM